MERVFVIHIVWRNSQSKVFLAKPLKKKPLALRFNCKENGKLCVLMYFFHKTNIVCRANAKVDSSNILALAIALLEYFLI